MDLKCEANTGPRKDRRLLSLPQFNKHQLASVYYAACSKRNLQFYGQAGIRASYLLCDSWFPSAGLFLAVKKRGMNVISMAKKTPKRYYLYNGRQMTAMQIYAANKKRRGCSKYRLSQVVSDEIIMSDASVEKLMETFITSLQQAIQNKLKKCA